MKLNTYETTIVIHPRLSTKEVNDTIKRQKKILKEDKAKIIQESNEGLQNLAYPIKKQTSGSYYTIQYQAPPTIVEKLENGYNINEDILRFLSIKLDKHGIKYHETKREKAQKEGESEGEEVAQQEVPASEVAPEREEEQEDNTKKKYCRFRKFGIKYIDYQETNFLYRFLNPQGKILPRRLTGTSAKYQRRVNQAIKRARILAKLPYVTDNLK